MITVHEGQPMHAAKVKTIGGLLSSKSVLSRDQNAPGTTAGCSVASPLRAALMMLVCALSSKVCSSSVPSSLHCSSSMRSPTLAGRLLATVKNPRHPDGHIVQSPGGTSPLCRHASADAAIALLQTSGRLQLAGQMVWYQRKACPVQQSWQLGQAVWQHVACSSCQQMWDSTCAGSALSWSRYGRSI